MKERASANVFKYFTGRDLRVGDTCDLLAASGECWAMRPHHAVERLDQRSSLPRACAGDHDEAFRGCRFQVGSQLDVGGKIWLTKSGGHCESSPSSASSSGCSSNTAAAST